VPLYLYPLIVLFSFENCGIFQCPACHKVFQLIFNQAVYRREDRLRSLDYFSTERKRLLFFFQKRRIFFFLEFVQTATDSVCLQIGLCLYTRHKHIRIYSSHTHTFTIYLYVHNTYCMYTSTYIFFTCEWSWGHKELGES